MYTHCQSRLQALGAKLAVLRRFQKLTTEDVKASTAIINPNVPGSTQIKLSWIWQTAGGHHWGLATSTSTPCADVNILECKFRMYIFISRYLSFTVHHVHWLHAHAQLMRWQEEVHL